MPTLASRSPQLAPVTYLLEQYEIPGFPGLMLNEASLGIEIDCSGDWFIEHIWIGDTADGRVVRRDEPLWAIIIEAISADAKTCERIQDECKAEAEGW
jgi:hypothetical protein